MELCPVVAVAAYLAVRGGAPGPFFQFVSGRALTRDRFVTRVREAMEAAGFDPKLYAVNFRLEWVVLIVRISASC